MDFNNTSTINEGYKINYNQVISNNNLKNDPVENIDNNLKIKNSNFLSEKIENNPDNTNFEKTIEKLEKAKDEINSIINNTNRRLEYSIHEKTNQIMVKVLDTDTNEIIRELPPEKNLDAVAKILELTGILIDEKA